MVRRQVGATGDAPMLATPCHRPARRKRVTPTPYDEGMMEMTIIESTGNADETMDPALANLAEAFGFTVVARCPEPSCELCACGQIGIGLPHAA